MMVNSLLLLMEIPSLLRNGFLILVARFICVPIRTGFEHMKLCQKMVFMGNDASCKIASVVIVRIKMFYGIVITLGDVKHVPNLKRNLNSLSTLDSKGYKYTAS